ncbi:MAG: MFS transporter [Eubacteriales bacterium]|nr:MFS transporter [Eubacteriales bacterium]
MERWKVNLYTLWVTQVFSLMGFGFCIPFVPFFLQDLGVSDPVQLSYYVGLSSTLPAATMAVAAPVWGIASDRYGRKMMIMRAMFFAAVLLALMGLSQSVFQFMVLRALQGIFTGTVTASMSFVSANTPENRISYALGLMTSSNFLGYSIGPFIGGMIAELLGYRICFAIGGGLMTVGFLLVVFLVKEDKNTYGYRIRSEEESKGKRIQVLSPFIIIVLLSLLFQRISRSVFVPFIPLYVQETLGTMVGATTYTGIISGATGFATALAALTITRLGDQHDKVKLAFKLTLLAVPVTVLLIFFRSLLGFSMVFTIYFFLAGGTEPILTSAASERTPPAMRGVLFGLLCTVSSLGAMVAPMIGSSISVGFGLRAILITIPLFTVSQLICLNKSRKLGQIDNKKE